MTCTQAAKLRHSEENYTVLGQNGLFECNKKNCLRSWKEIKGLVMSRQLQKSTEISGVEFGEKK